MVQQQIDSRHATHNILAAGIQQLRQQFLQVVEQFVCRQVLNPLEGIEIGMVLRKDCIQQLHQTALAEAVGSSAAHLQLRLSENLDVEGLQQVEELARGSRSLAIVIGIACQTGYRHTGRQRRLMHLGIDKHDRVQCDMRLVEKEPF